MAAGEVTAEIVADGTGFGAEFRRILSRFEDETISVRVTVDPRSNIAPRVRRIITQASAAAERDADQSGRRIGNTLGDGISRGVEGSDITPRVRRLLNRAAAAAQRDAFRSGQRIANQLSAGMGRGISFEDVFAGIGSFVASAGRLGAVAVGIGLVGSAALVASAQLIAFAAALAPAVGVVAGLPAVLGVAAAGLATLLVAFQGVGDAFSAALGDDVAKFEESLTGLAPAAVETARALREVAPAWAALGDAVQDAFFEGLADQLTAVSDALVGPLQAGMTQAASSLSGLAAGFAAVISGAESISFIEGSFDTLSNVIDNVSGPLANLLEAVFAVGNAINEAFGGETAGSGLADLIQRFADFLDAAAGSGQAVEWVNNALDVFSALGAILAPIAGIFGAIGGAAEGAGGNILGAFGTALQAVDDFLGSAAGVEFLAAIFETITALGSALGPIFSALGSALTPLATVAADLITTLAPGIETLIGALGEGLAAASPALISLGDALVTIVEAVSPLLPMLGEWLGLLIEIGANILSMLAPQLEVLAGLIEAVFGPQIEAILTVVNELFLALVPTWEELGAAAAELIPPIAELVTTFIEEMLPVVLELLPVLTQFAEEVGGHLVEAMTELLPYIIEASEFMIKLTEATAPIALEIASLAAEILGGLITALSTLVGWLIDVGVWFVGLGTAIGDFVAGARGRIDEFVGNVVSGFQRVRTWIDNLVNWFIQLPSRVLSAIGNLGEEIWSAITSGLSDIGDFIGFANGAIVTSPTVAALAEDGRPEVVIPLTRPGRAMQLADDSGLTAMILAGNNTNAGTGGSTDSRPVLITVNNYSSDRDVVRRELESVLADVL